MDIKVLTQEELLKEVKRLKESGARIITIAGQDLGENIEVLYFFHTGIGKSEVLKLIVPKKGGNEEVQSITPIMQGAYIAENELAEMFGLHVVGVPGRFFLHESITAPLRRK
ncbi:hydrogenase [Methanocella sp. CWC-04]|uniref:Hydrogenase n=1 Tax=Methanooceanicella nereidis TaxID=2052831 RepID=A0AAP2RDZ3_9EURY|nr:NADH-quinone oxidoreductase subunit C [Methanocella sp. CWC-04]MCD1294422.1 hydrogenase [Methanocella sp. CWC-04]